MKKLFTCSKLQWSLLVVIMLLGSFLRLWHLGENSFVADEFLDVNATYGYYQLSAWQAWDFNMNEASVRQNVASDERAWIYRIQPTLLYNYLEPTEFTIRLVSALWGIFTIILLWAFTLYFTRNHWIALIAAFLWAVSVPALEINRKIRMYSMFAPVYLALSWSIFILLEKGFLKVRSHLTSFLNINYWYLLPTLILAALAFHLHPLTGMIALVVFTYFALRLIDTKNQYEKVRYGAYLGVIVVSGVLVSILLPEQFAWAKELFGAKHHFSYIGHITQSYWHPLLGLFLIGFGSYKLITKHKHQESLWIVANFFVLALSAMLLWERNVGAQYIFFAQAFGLVLTAAGVYYAVHALAQKENKQFYTGLVLAAILVPNYGYFLLENNTYHMTSSGDSANYRKVFDYVKRNKSEEDVMITRNFRNYYYSGQGTKVFDFGSERSDDALQAEGKVAKITLEYVEQIVAEHSSGWVVYSDNDEQFITKEARQYFADNMTKITDSSLVRGKISVYKW